MLFKKTKDNNVNGSTEWESKSTINLKDTFPVKQKNCAAVLFQSQFGQCSEKRVWKECGMQRRKNLGNINRYVPLRQEQPGLKNTNAIWNSSAWSKLESPIWTLEAQSAPRNLQSSEPMTTHQCHIFQTHKARRRNSKTRGKERGRTFSVRASFVKWLPTKSFHGTEQQNSHKEKSSGKMASLNKQEIISAWSKLRIRHCTAIPRPVR